MTRLSTPVVAVTALLVALGLVACSPPGSPLPTTSPPSSVPIGSPDPPPASAPPATSASPPGPASDQGAIVARRSSAIDGRAVHLELYGVVRDGTLTHVSFGLRSDREVSLGEALAAPDAHDYEADGVTLVDGAHRKLYLVASHGDGSCLCTRTGGIELGPEPTLISATFAAPPAAVSSVDVSIPLFGVFPRVPVR